MPKPKNETPLKLDVVLVHGTWGRGFFRKKPIASWCKPDSKFLFQLRVKLGDRVPDISCEFSPFNWSGANSVFERSKASNDLALHLKNTFSTTEPVLIIAHSHGGNVALQAISKLKETSHVHVCTLATPFFRLLESRRTFTGSVILLRCLAIFAILAAVRGLRSKFGGEPSGYEILAWATVAGSIGWLIGTLLNKLLVNPVSGYHIHPKWEEKPWFLFMATQFDAKLLGDRLLVLRGIDDEAALSLAAGALTNRLLRFVYNFSMSGGAVLALILGVVIPTTWFGGFSVFIFPLVMAFATICLFLPSITRPVFGRELAFGAARCDAFYDSVPDSDNATIRTMHFEWDEERLLHAIYDHPDTTNHIADWIVDHLKRTLQFQKSVPE